MIVRVVIADRAALAAAVVVVVLVAAAAVEDRVRPVVMKVMLQRRASDVFR